MATESTTGTGDPQGSSAEGAGAGTTSTTSGGTAAAGGASSTTGDGTDWKAKYEELERKHAQTTGRAGQQQQTLQEQLATAQANEATAKAQAAAAAKELLETKVLGLVLDKAPEQSRSAIRLAARGILPEVGDLSDPAKAAETVLAKITEQAPALLKPTVTPLPHEQGTNGQRTGFAFTPSGERVF